MSEWKLRRTLQFERWRVDVNVSLPGSGEFSRYAEKFGYQFRIGPTELHPVQGQRS